MIAEQFAPPNYSFAPPPINSPPRKLIEGNAESESYSPAPPSEQVPPPPPPPPPEHPPPQSAPPEPLPVGAISRAPVRYNLPPPPSEIPSSEAELEKALNAEEEDEEEAPASTEDAPRSLRPGQRGFAERLMSKYGWSKGKGLGADGSGIVNPLRVQIEKRKKKSDAEGGGFRDPGGRGKIIGGKKNMPEKDNDAGKFGPMSEVIVLRGMVDNMDLDSELEGDGDGGLMQEIGDECGEKVGNLPRYSVQS
jgi:splicing factor 45